MGFGGLGLGFLVEHWRQRLLVWPTYESDEIGVDRCLDLFLSVCARWKRREESEEEGRKEGRGEGKKKISNLLVGRCQHG